MKFLPAMSHATRDAFNKHGFICMHISFQLNTSMLYMLIEASLIGCPFASFSLSAKGRCIQQCHRDIILPSVLVENFLSGLCLGLAACGDVVSLLGSIPMKNNPPPAPRTCSYGVQGSAWLPM